MNNESHSGSVAFFGLPNAGKSTLLNALIGQKIVATSPKPQTTRRKTRGIVTVGQTQMLLVDIPGVLIPGDELQKFMQRQVSTVLKSSDTVALVIEARFSDSEFATITKLLEQYGKSPDVIILTKTDTLKGKLELLPIIEKVSSKYPGARIVPVSAKKSEGLSDLLSVFANLMPEGDFAFDADAITDETERAIVAEIIREKCMLFLGQEVPYQLAVRIENFDESKREDSTKPIIDITAVILVEKDRQKAIVIGSKGQKIKEIGVSARTEIETLLDSKVMLRLLVKEDPLWVKTAQLS